LGDTLEGADADLSEDAGLLGQGYGFDRRSVPGHSHRDDEILVGTLLGQTRDERRGALRLDGKRVVAIVAPLDR